MTMGGDGFGEDRDGQRRDDAPGLSSIQRCTEQYPQEQEYVCMRVVGGRASRISSLRSEALAFDVIKRARQSARGDSSAIPREYTLSF